MGEFDFRELVHERLNRAVERIAMFINQENINKEVEMLRWISNKFPKEFHIYCQYAGIGTRHWTNSYLRGDFNE